MLAISVLAYIKLIEPILKATRYSLERHLAQCSIGGRMIAQFSLMAYTSVLGNYVTIFTWGSSSS